MIETLSPILNRKTIKGRKIRALDPMAKNRALLTAMADQRFAVNGFSNKNLREVLASHYQFEGKSKKQLSGAITRLIRDHGLIRKLSCQHRCRLTPQGQNLSSDRSSRIYKVTIGLRRIVMSRFFKKDSE